MRTQWCVWFGSDLRRLFLGCACWVAVGLGAVGHAARAQAADTLDAGTALREAIIASMAHAANGTPQLDEALVRFYARRRWSPAWLADGRPTPQASAVVAFLGRVPALGLPSEAYDAQGLADEIAPMAAAPPGLTERIRFDVSLSRSLLLLLSHLAQGRVDPASLGFSLSRGTEIDLAAAASDVSTADDVPAAIRRVEPQYAGYTALEAALARYQALATDSTLRPPHVARASLRPGDTYADMAALRRLLFAFGDLATDSTMRTDTANPLAYTPEIVAAVERFQQRHGLEGDGIVGPATFAALRVPIAQRVTQMELSLERWRWLPRRPPPRYIAINIPAFRLFAFDSDTIAAHPRVTMKVILGASRMRRATPVFEGTMRQIVFRPYWDVPKSIAIKELIPLLRPDTGYALHQSLEIVRGSDVHATLYPITARNLDRVAAGTLRLRQRPGASNALGLVKFVFPNAHNVYLHGTPETELFLRARRDFSHGCIRVEDPVGLAAFALGGQDDWSPSSIIAAMHAEQSRTVALARPIEVFILYATAVVNRDGAIAFYPDLYGHDAALVRLLEQATARAAQPRRPIAEDQ
jgi:murein L,D-transpeptidase YcbB/YkuD